MVCIVIVTYVAMWVSTVFLFKSEFATIWLDYQQTTSLLDKTYLVADLESCTYYKQR